ncbi:hypothetical protein CC80DRAFT_549707 [Byssothecium circinans]|uniref:Uncharacterized protein n=1 Tax=Byssothecium circinans TaxID=147558 RepID=A0A6A5TWB8_9PLEO|nr:hypothetical protein CC80DRAFT_549707 [Byssothecium circinans]
MPSQISIKGLFVSALAFFAIAQAARVPPGQALPSQSSSLNLSALTSGSLGDTAATTLLVDGILAESNKTVNTSPASSETSDTSEADQEKKDHHNQQNGVVVGATMGSAITSGLTSAKDGPTAALCEAVVRGATTALSSEAGLLIGDALNPPHERNEEKPNSTSTAPNTSSSAEPMSSHGSKFGTGMVAPLAGGLVGGAVGHGLAESICKGVFDDKGWLPKMLKDSLEPGMHSKGKKIIEESFSSASSVIVNSALVEAGVSPYLASQFTSSLQNSIGSLSGLSLDRAAEALQRNILQGASQISDVVAAGNAAAIAPELGAINQIGAATGIMPSPVGSFTPVQQFERFAKQIAHRSNLASSLSPGNKGLDGLKKVSNDLSKSASRAAKLGAGALRGVGGGIKSALHLIPAPFGSHGKEKVHHITKTHTKTETLKMTYLLTATNIFHKTATAADHVRTTKTVTAHVTKLHTATKTTINHVTRTRTSVAKITQKAKVTSTRWITKTKKATVTSTATITKTLAKTEKAKHTAKPVVQPISQAAGIDPRWSSYSTEHILCRSDSHQHLRCFGTAKHGIKYHSVKDKKYEKCAERDYGGAHCFDKKLFEKLPLINLRDNWRKVRGVACAEVGWGKHQMVCWGTPNRSTVKYKEINAKKWLTCWQNADECKV